MSLVVKLKHSNTSTIYFAAEKIAQDMTRSAFTAPLPGQLVVQYDFGIISDTFTFSGICDVGTTLTETNPACKGILENAARTWYTSSFAGTQGIKLYLGEVATPGGNVVYYLGQILRLTFELEAGREDRWTFSLTFKVQQRNTEAP